MMYTLVHGWLFTTDFQIDFLSLFLALFYYLSTQLTCYMMELNLKVYIIYPSTDYFWPSDCYKMRIIHLLEIFSLFASSKKKRK